MAEAARRGTDTCSHTHTRKPPEAAPQQQNGMFTAATCRLRLVYLLRIIPSEQESDSQISLEQSANQNS